MWMFVIVVWRMLFKVLRRFGRWALLVPALALVAALLGLNIWTAGTVLLALLLAVVLAVILLARRWTATAGLLPVTMLGAGLCGLWAAATLVGSWAAAAPFLFTAQAFAVPGQELAVPPGSGQIFMSGPGAGGGKPGGGIQSVTLPAGARLNWAYVASRPPQRPAAVYRRVHPHVVILGHSVWWGRLLIARSLVLLALGLWLARRAIANLRAQFARVAPHLRQWAREGNWGILLVPVTAFGLTIFGVRPWTIAALAAAVVITIRWPRVAADLVPLLLVGFALCGFLLVSRGMSGPRVQMAPVQFGAFLVDSPQSSLLAGAEASALLVLGAWLFPRTIGAHASG